MNTEERQKFWDTLMLLEHENTPEKMQILNNTIKYPHYLYRFRPITTSSLDALRSNKLYYSSANYYDDPFDSFSYIRWNDIKNEMTDAIKNDNNKKYAFDLFCKMHNVPIDQVEKVFNSKKGSEWEQIGTKLIKNIRQFIQANEFSICFTEESLNETLWLKYAENHHGFVMEYDLYDEPSRFDFGENYQLYNKINVAPSLYPIYYSDQKYDATEYIKAVIKQQLVQSFPPPFQAEAINSLPNMKWERERIGLIKKKCHEYDKEWRIILPNLYDMSQTTEKPSITWIPSSITIGLRTKQYEKSLIISLAKEAGISKVYQCYINYNDELDKKIIYSE